jgi:probable HAF family extracellular repeat protein
LETFMSARIAIATVVGCVVTFPMLGLGPKYPGSAAGAQPPKGRTEIATLSRLPSLGSNAEAHGVNESGTVVVGHSFDRAGMLYAVKWTLQSGSWVISTQPYPGSATAKGVDSQGDVVGHGATAPRRPVLWPAQGGYSVLGCAGEVAEAYSVSADGQVVAGQSSGRAVAWQSPQFCMDTLPPLEPGGFASARAVNGDGSIIGGRAERISQGISVPTRWIGTEGLRQAEQLDARPGGVRGANAGGDLAGDVTIPCGLAGGCQRAVIWYAASAARDLGTLGGQHSWSNDINAQGEVVGVSSTSQGTNTAFFWSASMGMFQLPANKWGVANAVSDVRTDGTRLVAGMDAQANAVVWIVRTP